MMSAFHKHMFIFGNNSSIQVPSGTSNFTPRTLQATV